MARAISSPVAGIDSRGAGDLCAKLNYQRHLELYRRYRPKRRRCSRGRANGEIPPIRPQPRLNRRGVKILGVRDSRPGSCWAPFTDSLPSMLCRLPRVRPRWSECEDSFLVHRDHRSSAGAAPVVFQRAFLTPAPRAESHFAACGKMAEREGFEPSVPLRVHMISNHAHSTTLSPLRGPGRRVVGHAGCVAKGASREESRRAGQGVNPPTSPSGANSTARISPPEPGCRSPASTTPPT